MISALSPLLGINMNSHRLFQRALQVSYGVKVWKHSAELFLTAAKLTSFIMNTLVHCRAWTQLDITGIFFLTERTIFVSSSILFFSQQVEKTDRPSSWKTTPNHDWSASILYGLLVERFTFRMPIVAFFISSKQIYFSFIELKHFFPICVLNVFVDWILNFVLGSFCSKGILSLQFFHPWSRYWIVRPVTLASD